jgi:EAL domain-containing protein (putative c-di-GMP-specific phosphodiesterase class I)
MSTQGLSKHALRMRRTLLILGGACILSGVGWGTAFGMGGAWAMVVVELGLVLVGVTAIVLVRRGRQRLAAGLMISSLAAWLMVLCLALDIPTPAAPRASHHYFLIMGMTAFLMFRGEKPWIRHGVPLASFAAYFLFASTYWVWNTPYAMPYRIPEEMRATATWATNAVAFGVMYAMLWVMQADLKEQHALLSELRKALAERQLALHYQPQVDADGRVVGAEALLRWQHPQLGRVSPVDFIPVAEQSGLILPVGHWVLGTACAQLVQWAERPQTAHLVLAVNVSAQQFHQPDFVAQVMSVLERSGARASRLKLELTESMLVNDMDDIIAKMTLLKSHGVGLSLDDFGTGYSSLSYLKKLPVDQLKVDKSFVDEVLTSARGAAIVRTVVGLAQSMGLSVIAEGVETEAQRVFLAGLGCPAYQGYLACPPVPIERFEAFLLLHEATRVAVPAVASA